MSKELIDRLKSYIPSGDGHNSQYANDLADAVAILEAKAAPVGERDAFEREERYTVIKHKDLTFDDRAELDQLIHSRHIPTRECLIIESDWPEYEPAWRMIEARVTGAAHQRQQAREVVMPEYDESRTTHHVDEAYQNGWNACLDEFARLNGKEVGRG